MKILLVDDDPVSLERLRALMRPYGSCSAAKCVECAVDAFTAALEDGEAFDLVSLDLTLPDGRGDEAIERLRALERRYGLHPSDGARVVVVTGSSQARDVMRSFRGGASGYLVKPVTSDKLAEVMQAIERDAA
ncbi:MAG: response regulator transcription factor [Myxococcales bacterium]|nr:response regulator transcription factor [Myxococcales bacterium]